MTFASYAWNLVRPPDLNGTTDIFVRDLIGEDTDMASVTSNGEQIDDGGNHTTAHPKIFGDGRYVVFTSWAWNVVPNDGNNAYDIFLHDRLTGKTTRASVDSHGNEDDTGLSGALFPGISDDGRVVIFRADFTQLAPADTNNAPDIFVHAEFGIRLGGPPSRGP